MMKLRSFLTRFWLPCLVVVIAEIVTTRLDNLFFPPPSSVLQKLLEVATFEWITSTLGQTLFVFVVGYISGVVLGLVLGSIIGISETAYSILMPVAVFIRKMPTVAKLPILLAVFGVSVQAQLSSVVITVSFVMFVVAAKSTSMPHPVRHDLARLLKLSLVERAFGLYLPSNLAQIVAGARFSIQLAFVLTLLSETLVGGGGIGGFLIEAKSLYNIELMWVAIVIVGIIGFILHEVFAWIENRLTPGLQRKESEFA